MAFGFQPPVFLHRNELWRCISLNCNIDNMGTYLVFSNKKEEAKERRKHSVNRREVNDGSTNENKSILTLDHTCLNR